jgi:hypothetical protein
VQHEKELEITSLKKQHDATVASLKVCAVLCVFDAVRRTVEPASVWAYHYGRSRHSDFASCREYSWECCCCCSRGWWRQRSRLVCLSLDARALVCDDHVMCVRPGGLRRGVQRSATGVRRSASAGGSGGGGGGEAGARDDEAESAGGGGATAGPVVTGRAQASRGGRRRKEQRGMRPLCSRVPLDYLLNCFFISLFIYLFFLSSFLPSFLSFFLSFFVAWLFSSLVSKSPHR